MYKKQLAALLLFLMVGIGGVMAQSNNYDKIVMRFAMYAPGNPFAQPYTITVTPSNASINLGMTMQGGDTTIAITPQQYNNIVSAINVKQLKKDNASSLTNCGSRIVISEIRLYQRGNLVYSNFGSTCKQLSALPGYWAMRQQLVPLFSSLPQFMNYYFI